MTPSKTIRKSPKGTTATRNKSKGFTDEERAAMKEHVQELRAEARRGPRAREAEGESDVLAKIAEMPEADRAMAQRLHAIIKTSAPAPSRQRSASATRRTSTKAPCGRPPAR